MAILRDNLGIATFFVSSANDKMRKCKCKNAIAKMTANEKMQIPKCKLQIEKCKWKNDPGSHSHPALYHFITLSLYCSKLKL